MTSKMNDALLGKPESARHEFKSFRAEPAEIAVSVCAMLNGDGGTIVIGVDDHGQVESGIDVHGFASKIESYLNANITPPSLWSVSSIAARDGEVIEIDVPAASDKPYVYDGSIYIRRDTGSAPANPAEIRELVTQRYAEATPWEKRPAMGLEMSDLVPEQIRQTVDMASQTRNYLFNHPNDPAAVLSDLGLMQSGIPTNAADVLFARNPSCRLPQTRVRATVYKSDKGDDFVDDRLFEGNAFELLKRVFGFVEQHVAVRAEFKPGSLAREDRPQYPFWALREGIVNAIIHRDYSVFSGGMSVDVYPDRIEIWNTGHLPQGWTLRDLTREHPSQPANPNMAHVFYLRGVIERVGRGTQKIVADCMATGLLPPQWLEAAGGIRLIINGRRQEVRLNRRQRELLDRLRPGEELRPKDYYAEHEETVSQRQARRDLSDLVKGGWLVQQGKGRAMIYRRTDQAAS